MKKLKQITTMLVVAAALSLPAAAQDRSLYAGAGNRTDVTSTDRSLYAGAGNRTDDTSTAPALAAGETDSGDGSSSFWSFITGLF
ncbi:MAG TPA: hypothetical protein VF692_10880 [Pyrinomonadaceae bacterium]|jgi:hypothetical protein